MRKNGAGSGAVVIYSCGLLEPGAVGTRMRQLEKLKPEELLVRAVFNQEFYPGSPTAAWLGPT